MKFIVFSLILAGLTINTALADDDRGECRKLFRSSNQIFNTLQEKKENSSNKLDALTKNLNAQNKVKLKQALKQSLKSLEGYKGEYKTLISKGKNASFNCPGRSGKASRFIERARLGLKEVEGRIVFIKKTISYL